MFRRSRIVWKLSAVFIAIILIVFVVSGYVSSLVDEHYALVSARDLCRFNSATIQQSIEKSMMTRDNESIDQLIDNLAKKSPVYREMRLVSHSGEIVASPFDSDGEKLLEQSRPCQVCHKHDDPLAIAEVPSHDEIIELADGTRVVSVITPILNAPTCSTADCHVHADASPVLGLLQTDYSLSRVDAITSARNMQTATTVLTAIILGIVGTWVTVGRLLERPISILKTGMRSIADGDLGFRFNVRRKDEFATVAESFNDMTIKLESSLSELRETRDYLEGIVENSADIIITVNPSGLIQTFNSGAESALDYERSEVIGKRIETLFADPQERDAAIGRLERSDNVANFKTRFLTKNGDVRDVLLTLSRLHSPDGDAIGTVGISKDITREMKLLDELRDAKEYLEGMIENSADIIIAANSEGSIETVNRGAEEALGYRREELIGEQIESLYVDPRERYAVAALLEESGNVKNYETRLLAKDGRVRNVLLTLSRLHNSEGKSIGTIGISKDITHEKNLQDELRDAKEYVEGMIENSADIIIAVNSEGLIETVNRGAEEALDYRREELIGEQIETLYVDPSDRQAAAALLDETGNAKNYETRLRTKHGRVLNVLLTLSRLRDSEGRRIGTIGISKDITHEKELQRELVRSQKLAAIGQAVTGIQHTIKNMLNSLTGGSYLVRLGMSKDNRQRIEEGWVMVEEGIQRIRDLSRSMLHYAKEWKPESQRVDIDDLLRQVCDQNRQIADDKNVSLCHDAHDGLPAVSCDPKLIHTAVTDILVNAIDACTWKDYGDAGHPEVVLASSLAGGGGSVVIEIRDNGCGMTEDIRRNVFTPFFSTKKTLGTGLGLATTARIVNAHGGEITVESEPEQGATFRCRLPIHGPKGAREAADDQEQPQD